MVIHLFFLFKKETLYYTASHRIIIPKKVSYNKKGFMPIRFLSNRPEEYVASGVVSFFVFMFICILILPSGLWENYGVSYYGSFLRTLIPYLLAFVSMSVCLFLAAVSLDSQRGNHFLAQSFRGMSVLLLFLAATPHNILSRTHMVLGSTLFILQLVLSLWFVLIAHFEPKHLTLFLLLLLSGILSAQYVARSEGYLIETQLVFQLCFSLMVIDLLRHNKIEASKSGR